MPLTDAAIASALEVPGTPAIRMRAASLKHPILKSVPFDDRDGLSPDEAAILAVVANPTLRAIRHAQGIAKAQLLQAGIIPNPQLSYSFEAPVGGGTTGNVTGMSFGLSWEITSLLGRGARRDTARAQAASVNLEVAWQEWQVAEWAKLHLYRLVLAGKWLAEAERLESVRKTSRQTTRRAVELGLKTAPDLVFAETAARDARARVVRARAEKDVERLALNRAIGLPSDRTVAPQHDVVLTFVQTLPPTQELVKDLEKRRLDLLALRRGYQSQEARVRAAIWSQFPKLSIGLTTAQDTDGLQTVGAGISIDIPFFERNQGRIAVARATRQQLFDAYAARLFEARADVARLSASLRAMERRLKGLDAARRAMKDVVARFGQAADDGRANVLIYCELLARFHEKQLDYLANERRLADLAIALEIASGRYLFAGAPGPQENSGSRKTETPK